MRAMVYALMTGENSTKLNEVMFLAGCNRFGIDNPLPTVRKRLYLFGNTQDVENMLRETSMRLTISLRDTMPWLDFED